MASDGLLSRLRTGVQVGFQALKSTPAPTADNVEMTLDNMLSMLDDEDVVGALLQSDDVMKQLAPVKNKLKIFRTANDLYSFHSTALRGAMTRIDDKMQLMPHGDPQRDFQLAEFWKHEPILAGAVYSMSAKMSTLTWTISGKKRTASYFADVFTNAVSMNGMGWGDFISSTSQDFYTLDRGSFWITPRHGSHLVGRLSEIGVMDGLACALTGNMHKPVLYSSFVTGQDLWLRPGEYAHFSSLPSSREEYFGTGFCAVSRAYKAARILMGLGDYDWEKLNNMPPEGVAAITGLTQDEFQDSLALWRAAREKNSSLTYPQVLWLLGSQPNTTVDVDFVGFSQIPEAFKRESVIEQYVNTLALDFGVDAREFWPISSSSLGTAAESEIQHMKAKGKGPGEFVTILERYLNGEMPNGEAEFRFDTQDIGEDQAAAAIAKGWIDAFMPLYAPGKGSVNPVGGSDPEPPGKMSIEKAFPPAQPPASGGSGPEPLITKDQFLRLLIDRRVLPNWVVQDKKIMLTDLGVSEKEGDDDTPVVITWKDGVISMEREAAYEIRSVTNASPSRADLPFAELKNGSKDVLARLKELGDQFIESELPRNIRGKPLPEKEALRGPRITVNTVKAEIERWRDHPILSKYVPTLEEDVELKDILERVQAA